jgi:hypothetical protein
MKKLAAAAFLILLATNAAWLGAYKHLDLNYMQEEGLRDEADDLLRHCQNPTPTRLQTVADRPKYIIKVTKISATEAAISCLNGADPAGIKLGETVYMSCGR